MSNNTNISNNNKKIQIAFEKNKCFITDKSVNAGYCLNIQNIETCDLKYLTYKITEELINRGEL